MAKVFADDLSLYSRAAPSLRYGTFRVSDEGGPLNGKLDRGEESDLVLVLRNAGAGISGFSGQLVSENPHVTVLDGSGWFGPAGEGETTASTSDWFRVRASSDAPVESRLDCRLVLSGAGYQDTVLVPLIVGDSMNLPDGPDAYGYCIYDYTDSCYAERPEFDWLEARGLGTRLGLGADDVLVLALPAEFGTWQYYGQGYDSISVCSNGWIAAGASDRLDFVNVLLPYPNAPPNIVAAAWDDLDPSEYGDIWFCHDTARHRIIVEFDSIPYFGHAEDWEQVQIQVYDQTVTTPTGDNALAIQFKTVNHFRSVTAGLQNRDGSAGLTHFWEDWYPRTAAPLGPQQALWIQTMEPSGCAERPGLAEPGARLSASPSVFRHRTRIRLVDEPGDALVAAIYAVSGARVSELRPIPGGPLAWDWDGRDAAGNRVAPGMYFAVVRTGSREFCQKLVVCSR